MKTAAVTTQLVSADCKISANSSKSCRTSHSSGLQKWQTARSEVEVRASQPGAMEAVTKQLITYNRQWLEHSRKERQILNGLPSGVKGMFVLQKSFHSLHLQTQIATKAAEGVSSTLKRLSQSSS